ncbi:MAG: AMP-binding protein, partial [Actinomycetota bacterium]
MSGIGGWARATPDAPALVSLRGVRTFAEVDLVQRKVARVLRANGVSAGERVAVCSKNRDEILEVCGGALRAGIVPVPINTLLTPPEVAYILEDSGARWLFTDRSAPMSDSVERTVTFGDAYARLLFETEALDEMSDHIRGRPMHYTSGTTGQPKGVFVAPCDEAEAARSSRRFCETWGLDSTDMHLVCSPLAHSAPLRFALRTLEAGGAVVVQERFDPAETLAAVEMFGVSSTFVVPTHLQRIISLDRKGLARYDLSSIRMLVHAGAPIGEELKRRVIEIFPPASVWEFYGATEGQATRISSTEWLARPGSVGKAHPGAGVEVRDPSSAPVPPEEVGQVWVTDPEAERWSYHGAPDKTEAAWNGDWFTVGDLGWLDGDGYLFLTGRKDDVIISGGVNVYPQEIEEAMSRHPGISEVVVYGAPNEEWGQEVRADVVGAPGATATEPE